MTLAEYADKKLHFGSGGFVRYVEHLGDDASIVRAARVSYGDGTKTVREDAELIGYLLRNSHMSPFEMCNMTFHVRMPIYVANQFKRQRTFRLNEYSQRYSKAIDEMETTRPDCWRTQSTTNKQASDKYLPSEWTQSMMDIINWDDWSCNSYEDVGNRWASPGHYLTEREQQLQSLAREVYEERLAFGVAREQARKDLPLSTYTELYVNADLRNLLSFLHKRLDSHAQPEIRELATCLHVLVKAWCPAAHDAWNTHVLHSMSLSDDELTAIGAHGGDLALILQSSAKMTNEQRAEWLSSVGMTSKSERIDFINKVKKLCDRS